jgi:hypothetical protein
MAVAVAGGGLTHEVFMGPIAAQAPIATGATVGDRLRGQQTQLWMWYRDAVEAGTGYTCGQVGSLPMRGWVWGAGA